MITLSIEYFICSLFIAALFGAFILQVMVCFALTRTGLYRPCETEQSAARRVRATHKTPIKTVGR